MFSFPFARTTGTSGIVSKSVFAITTGTVAYKMFTTSNQQHANINTNQNSIPKNTTITIPHGSMDDGHLKIISMKKSKSSNKADMDKNLE